MARDVRVAILGDSSDFSRAVRNVQSDAGRLDSTFRGVKRMVGGLALGVAAHEVFDLGRGFVDAAIESQKVTAQTDAVIESMGDTARVSAESVAQLSSELSLKSGIDDELIQSGANVLLTFGKVRNEVGKGNKVFDRANAAALDMSVALGTDMKSASMLVGKALNDPIRGLTALRRSGIQFTEQQEDQIRTMVESGDTLGAQKILLEELERQFGGSAEAQATSADKLSVAWGNVQEQLGNELLPVVEAVASFLAENLPGAVETLGDALHGVTGVIGGVVDTFQTEGLGGVLNAIGTWIAETAPIVGEKLLALGEEFINWVGPQVPPLLGALGDLLADVADWILDTGVGLLADAVVPLVPALIGWITDPDTLEAFGDFLDEFVAWVVEDGIPGFFEAGKDLGAAVGRGIVESIKEAGLWAIFGSGEGSDEQKVKEIMGRASGGPVSAHTPFIVGERGPELFVPQRAGTIVPNHMLGAPQPSSSEINININGRVDPDTLGEMTHRLRVAQLEMAG